jgi:hypothetical protein
MSRTATKILGALAIVMAIGLIAWTAISWRGGWTRPEPKVLTGGQAWNSVELLPPEQLKVAFDGTKAQMEQRNHAGNRWLVVSKAAGWVAFLCATFITALAAWFGRDTVTAGTPVDQALAQTRASLGRCSWIAGIIAALIAASTAISDRAQNEASICYKASDAIQTLIAQTKKQLREATTKEEAQEALDEMSQLASRE